MSDDLVEAAFVGDVQAVSRLLDAGADIDAQGRNWNPLHAAIESENVACVHLLIRRGADIARPAGDMSPLAHAVDISIDGTIQSGASPGDEPTEIINLLLDAGADPAPALDVAMRYRASHLIALLQNAARSRLTGC